MKEGIIKAVPTAEVVLVPVADGGDGMVDVALDALWRKRKESSWWQAAVSSR